MSAERRWGGLDPDMAITYSAKSDQWENGEVEVAQNEEVLSLCILEFFWG